MEPSTMKWIKRREDEKKLITQEADKALISLISNPDVPIKAICDTIKHMRKTLKIGDNK